MKYLTDDQVEELRDLIHQVELDPSTATVLIKKAKKARLLFNRLKGLIKVAPEYIKLSDSQIDGLIEQAQMRHLTAEQAEILGVCYDDDEFIEKIDIHIGVLKAGISANELRSKPSGVQKELDRLRKAFNDLSTDARFHLDYLFEMQFIRDDHSWTTDDKGITHTEGDNALQKIDRILKVPYSRLNRVNLQRQSLMHFIRVLNNTYGPKPYDDTGRLPPGDDGERLQPNELECVARIMIEASGMDSDAKSITRQARKYADMKPSKIDSDMLKADERQVLEQVLKDVEQDLNAGIEDEEEHIKAKRLKNNIKRMLRDRHKQ